jgi:hypothetical protein
MFGRNRIRLSESVCGPINRVARRLVALACIGLFVSADAVSAQYATRSGDSAGAAGRRVALSFIVLGCNRIQESDWAKTRSRNPSSANVPQLRQTFLDITQLRPIPPYLFFMGDLVVNLAVDDGDTLRGQLDAWARLYKRDPSGIAEKTTLIPFTGNHEVLQGIFSNDSLGAKVEVLNAATHPVWLHWLARNGFDRFAGNGPTNAAPNPDMLQRDESKMTYSFNIGDVHFIVLNTDALTTTLNIGWIAYHWIERDIRRAERNDRIKTIFVLGHKPILGPIEAAEPGSAIINPLGFQLNWLLNRSHKARAYISAHAHMWQAEQLGDSSAVWQVIAGNGGSKLEAGWKPRGGPYYGFTLVKVYDNGEVGVVSYARPVPPVYYQGPTQPARPRPEIFLRRKH